MGKNLKDKECGKGICQRKDVDELGKRHDKYFPTLPEARNWLKQAKEAPLPQDDLFIPNEMTVDTWFEFWINNIVGDLAPNTRRNYRERYKHNIQPVLGKMRLVDMKPMYCKIVLNRMEATYAGSTIRQTYIAMGTMFKSAVMNGLINKHPMDGVRFNKPVRAVDDINFLTVDEQDKFLEVAKRSHNYHQYALILETGLRTGEVIGLTWDAIDWEKRTLTVNKTLEFRHKQQEWRAGPPKTKHSYCEKGERRKRTHRLITRGAVVESVAPTVKVLTEVEFYAFAESVFALPEVQTLLAEAIHAHGQGRA